MKLTSLFLTVAAAANRPVKYSTHGFTGDVFQTNDQLITDKYSSSNHATSAAFANQPATFGGVVTPPTTWSGTTTSTCPVSCVYDGTSIRMQHHLDHAMMTNWEGGVVPTRLGGVDPESELNKVFHRCFHRAAGTTGEAMQFGLTPFTAGQSTGARACSCECAQWAELLTGPKACAPDTSCPTTCGLTASTVEGSYTPVCKFHSKELDDLKCPETSYPDEPTCSYACPATAPCPVPCEGEWEVTGTCGATCGASTFAETYKVTQAALHGGAQCEAAHGETKQTSCNEGPCCIEENIDTFHTFSSGTHGKYNADVKHSCQTRQVQDSAKSCTYQDGTQSEFSHYEKKDQVEKKTGSCHLIHSWATCESGWSRVAKKKCGWRNKSRKAKCERTVQVDDLTKPVYINTPRMVTGVNGAKCGWNYRAEEYGCQWGVYEKTCEGKGATLKNQGNGKGDKCYWTSPIASYNTAPGFDNIEAKMRLLGKDEGGALFDRQMGEGNDDYAKVLFRTCTGTTEATCGSWVEAGKHTGHTNNEQWETITMEKTFSNVLLTKSHGYLQTRIELKVDEDDNSWPHFEDEDERYEMDWLKVEGKC